MITGQDLIFFVPELLLCAFSFVILALPLFVKNRNILGLVSLAAITGALLFSLKGYSAPPYLFFNLLKYDSLGCFFKEIVLICAFLTVLASMGYRLLSDRYPAEYYFLILNAALAVMLLASANNLLVVYVAFEMLSLSSCILVSFLRGSILAGESALKYFIFGALSSAVMLFGISYVYGIFGTLDLSIISGMLPDAGPANPALLVALIFILVGFCFKCALAPFHMWVPDVYEGAPTPITGFISVAPKVAGFILLIRVFLYSFGKLSGEWPGVLTAISILTMTVGNILAIPQNNIKRMLAYSSIAHAGYILIGLVAVTDLGTKSVLFYIFTYALMNLGAFISVILISNSIKSDDIRDYAGLYKKDPQAAFLLTVFLLSLAGIPPLAGFMAKFLVFAAAIEAKLIMLAVAGVINSIIALYYYVRVMRYMYLEEPGVMEMERKPLSLSLALAIALFGIIVAGVWPYPFLSWIAR